MNLKDWENLIKKTRSDFIKNAPHYIGLAVEKNIEIIDQKENSINFIALAPDFEIEISNFKDLDKKDLDVRARKLKG